MKRRRALPVVLALIMVAGISGSSFAKTASPRVPGSALPNHRVTPGAHFAVGKVTICQPGYSARVRNVPEGLKDKAYARYGLKRVPYAYEVDHLVSLELGGSNAITNLWPEHYYEPWGARTKDRLENRLHALVCAGHLTLASAQRQEAANWITAYERYVGASSASGTTTTPSPPPPSPPPANANRPAGATAKCNDGTYSYSAHHSGSCSYHDGVALFYS